MFILPDPSVLYMQLELKISSCTTLISECQLLRSPSLHVLNSYPDVLVKMFNLRLLDG